MRLSDVEFSSTKQQKKDKKEKQTKIAAPLVIRGPQQAGALRWVSEMGRQQGLHLPLALITVKIISDGRRRVEAGERGG